VLAAIAVFLIRRKPRDPEDPDTAKRSDSRENAET
jgi:hypothetical protein